MATWLRLNRGSTYDPINLNGSKCVLRTPWRPRVAKRKRSQMGGRPYEDVQETIPLRIQSSVSGSEALALLAVLVEALEQAYAWELGATVDPVILEYLPDEFGSQTVPLKTEVLSTQEAENLLELQPGFDQLLKAYVIDFDLPLRRRGHWLDAEETPTASSSVTNPGKMSVTFVNDAKLPSPVKLSFTSSVSTLFTSANAFIVVADTSDKILLQEAEGMTLGTQWTSVGDANARGGNVARRTPTTTTLSSLTKTSVTFNSDARLFTVYANLKNNSASVTYTCQVILNSTGNNASQSKPIIVPASQTEKVFMLGFFALPNSLKDVTFQVTPSSAPGAGHGLDVDYLVVLAVDEFTRSIAVVNSEAFSSPVLDPAFLLRPSPYLKTAGDWYVPYRGDLYLLNAGSTLTAMIFGNTGALWGLRDISSNLINYSLTATRRLGYVTPR